MADYDHLMNLIQGEVIRIRERRPLVEQLDLLDDLVKFLSDQQLTVTLTKLRVCQDLRSLKERPSEDESAQTASG